MIEYVEMKKQIILSGITVALIVMGLPGCSKEGKDTAPIAKAEQKLTTFQPFENLSKFKGKAPEELLSDELIAARLRTILPQEQMACLKEVFNYMPDLDVKPSGNVYAELNGSHAENWMKAMLDIQPSGEINIMLDCSFDKSGAQPFYLFTNRNVDDVSAASIKSWLENLAINGDENAVVSDGTQKRELKIVALKSNGDQKKAKNLSEQKTDNLDYLSASCEISQPIKQVISIKNIPFSGGGKVLESDICDTLKRVHAQIYDSTKDSTREFCDDVVLGPIKESNMSAEEAASLFRRDGNVAFADGIINCLHNQDALRMTTYLDIDTSIYSAGAIEVDGLLRNNRCGALLVRQRLKKSGTEFYFLQGLSGCSSFNTFDYEMSESNPLGDIFITKFKYNGAMPLTVQGRKGKIINFLSEKNQKGIQP